MARGERLLVLCFIAGLLIHSFRDRIRFSAWLFAASLVAIYACLAIHALGYLIALPAAYATIYLGLQNPRKSRLLASGDYSYGVFLYGYPLQQALVASTPLARVWWGNIALALPLALLAGVLSWHLVEKRVLARKHLLFAVHQRLSALWSRRRGTAAS
jgi:peptidoglycan/LPS O-acetylase OafA/YrhL